MSALVDYFKRPALIKPKSYPTMLIDKDWTQRSCWSFEFMAPFFDQIHDLEVRDDDVWLCANGKTGSTWLNELMWLVVNNFDFETAKKEPLELRTPLLDFTLNFTKYKDNPFNEVNSMTSPRTIKTHLSLPLMPQQIWLKKPKLLYVFRNPKDSFVSQYYFYRNFGGFLDLTLDEYVVQTIQYDKQSFNHVLEFYQLRNEPWIYYTSFENLKTNLRGEIEKICKFLNKPINEQQMAQMLHHLSYEEMKKNPQVNHMWEKNEVRNYFGITKFEENAFVRQGKIGGHKQELHAETIKILDEWIEENLKPHNLTVEDLTLQAIKK